MYTKVIRISLPIERKKAIEVNYAFDVLKRQINMRHKLNKTHSWYKMRNIQTVPISGGCGVFTPTKVFQRRFPNPNKELDKLW